MNMRNCRSRLAIAGRIAGRGIRAALLGFGLYGVTCAGALLAVLATGVHLGALAENGLLVIANPLNFPFYMVTVLSAMYLAVIAAISISRERERGTLEVLFYGPVDPVSLMIAKFLEPVGIYGLILAMDAVILAGFGSATGFGFPGEAGLAMLLALAPLSCMIALGLLLSALTARIRGSVLALVAILFGLLIIQWGDTVVNGLENLPPALVPAKALLSLAAGLLSWVSPFAYLSRGWAAIETADPGAALLVLAGSLAYTLILLALAVLSLRVKGVRTR
ncbi:ABC transporter permease subunit [Hydrogenispora ethanolica]|nr:ABC transporter permease subunit [Hydrogenispora ethanolica]